MAFCIPKELVDGFLGRLKAGEINPMQLSNMTSAERRTYFEGILGKENAQQVNALFESKLLLKNQQLGMINWAKKVSGITPEIRRDMITKIENMREVLQPENIDMFLSDLIESRLKFRVTPEEASQLVEMSKLVEEKKKVMENGGDRLEYGLALTKMKDFVSDLKSKGKPLFSKNLRETTSNLLGTTKSLLSSLDNSFFGRQGIKTLFTNPLIWSKNFLKSWKDIARELKGENAITPIKADIYSRPNAINGKYEKMKLAIGLLKEEAFPSSLPSRIPLFGRLFKASESAYNGAALRLRADIADKVIEKAESQGVNMLDPVQAESLGKVVNSLTGRGNIGRIETIGNDINAAFFSIKFLKSNWDTLTAHAGDWKMTGYAKKQAAINLMKIVTGMAGTLLLAEQLYPGSVNTDTTSADFGKIKIGNTRFDITGGMSSLIILASRVANRLHKAYIKGEKKKYSDITALDLLGKFSGGKLSPAFGVARDILSEETFEGEKPTLLSEIKSLTVPLPITTAEELLTTKKAAPFILSFILSELGIGVNTYSRK